MKTGPGRTFLEPEQRRKNPVCKISDQLQCGCDQISCETCYGKGYYEGVNLSLSYCDDCGHEELDMDVCPECGSTNLTKIERMNGYLSYSRVKGDTRLNDAKMAEIAERKSM